MRAKGQGEVRGMEAKDRELLSHVCIPSIMTSETKKSVLDDSSNQCSVSCSKGKLHVFYYSSFIVASRMQKYLKSWKLIEFTWKQRKWGQERERGGRGRRELQGRRRREEEMKEGRKGWQVEFTCFCRLGNGGHLSSDVAPLQTFFL